MTNNPTGYGPSHGRSRLYFTGNSEDFKIWETRFTNYIYTLDRGVYKALLPPAASEREDEDFTEKNRRAYAELVQVLDERSLMLIITDNANDGRAAFKTLRAHYDSTEKPRVLTLYEELTTLSMSASENITDYLIRAERASNGLRSAGENISDNLVIAMILKGLPEFYKAFVVVHTQMDKYKTLIKFKAALVNYANTEALRAPTAQSCALSSTSSITQSTHKRYRKSTDTQPLDKTQCLSCGKQGHQSTNCYSKSNLKCNYCQKPGHVESVCFVKKRRQQAQNSAHSTVSDDYSFTTSIDNLKNGSEKFLVDCGATSHILNNKDLFISFDQTFQPENHYIELADGRRSNQLAKLRGDARITIPDSEEIMRSVLLKKCIIRT